ncbi:YidH family protein [Christensenella timonensis]|uniref:YidH family protein n=1 Tax=Christensenella timonensis TaxID=1816678 RepID=UPI00082981F0|nr:DUF202 domain-containing protein [Christensenella timonensis]
MDNKSTTDQLAYERTMLANERTFLAYVRTFIGFVASGAGIIILLELPFAVPVGIAFIGAGIFFLTVGICRYRQNRKRIRQFLK